MKRALLALLLAIAAVAAGVVVSLPAGAASPGVGFGSWAPISAHGWHGSMSISGMDTYCILPGRPVPTGDSTDRGVSFDAAGIDPQRLTAINMLVSTYGQTSDPVQAASVGWAVKAIADWDEALHTFGYAGDSLQGAIHWTFSALAPGQDQAVQNLAAAYYTEAMALPAGASSGSGRLDFTTRNDDVSRGTVTVNSDVAGARGTVTLDNAVFADTGSASRDDVVTGATYEIVSSPPAGQSSYTVSGSGTLRGGFLPAVRWFTTADGQDTAGPGGVLEFPVEGADAAPRETTFAPQIATQVTMRYAASGLYVDDVTFTTAHGSWGRTSDGGYAPVTASATVYRTTAEPVVGDAVPADAKAVGTLEVTTDPRLGPTAPYRVSSSWEVTGTGFYTAVWRIDAEAQSGETRAMLDDGYLWTERFGEASQVMLVTSVSSAAEPQVAVGAGMSDLVIVEGAVPANGLDVWTEVFRVPDGTAAADACTPENLVWSAPPVRVVSAGSTSFTAPAVSDFGVYVWQERATDADGVAVHTGLCGTAAETTRVDLPTVTTRATPGVGLGGEATDVATVAGSVPVTGVTEVVFEVYRGDGAMAGACLPEDLVARTSAVSVTSAGEYTSPPVRLTVGGAHSWMEYLWWTSPEGERRLLAQGACGAEDETTIVEQPTLVTRAQERAAIGAVFTDTATVTGLGDGIDAELVFSVFHADTGAEPVCSSETLEATLAPVIVDSSGTFTSPDAVSDRAGTKLWLAELRYRPTPDAEPVVLSRGECGETAELTIIDSLATTGDATIPGLAVCGAGGGLVIAGVLLMIVKRRRRARTVADRRMGPVNGVLPGGIQEWRP